MINFINLIDNSSILIRIPFLIYITGFCIIVIRHITCTITLTWIILSNIFWSMVLLIITIICWIFIHNKFILILIIYVRMHAITYINASFEISIRVLTNTFLLNWIKISTYWDCVIKIPIIWRWTVWWNICKPLLKSWRTL